MRRGMQSGYQHIISTLTVVFNNLNTLGDTSPVILNQFQLKNKEY